jgi:hypothetical protein
MPIATASANAARDADSARSSPARTPKRRFPARYPRAKKLTPKAAIAKTRIQ